MDRRAFLYALAAGVVVTATGLWLPGQKLISIPKLAPDPGYFCSRTIMEAKRNIYPVNYEYAPGILGRYANLSDAIRAGHPVVFSYRQYPVA